MASKTVISQKSPKQSRKTFFHSKQFTHLQLKILLFSILSGTSHKFISSRLSNLDQLYIPTASIIPFTATRVVFKNSQRFSNLENTTEFHCFFFWYMRNSFFVCFFLSRLLIRERQNFLLVSSIVAPRGRVDAAGCSTSKGRKMIGRVQLQPSGQPHEDSLFTECKNGFYLVATGDDAEFLRSRSRLRGPIHIRGRGITRKHYYML